MGEMEVQMRARVRVKAQMRTRVKVQRRAICTPNFNIFYFCLINEGLTEYRRRASTGKQGSSGSKCCWGASVAGRALGPGSGSKAFTFVGSGCID